MQLQLELLADYRSVMPVSALLPASLGALVVGPLLSRYARSRPGVTAFVDGFIVVSIGGLVLLDVVPHALEHRDVIAMVCMALGYLVPGMVERMLRYGVRQTHTAILSLALLGVAVHSMLDGSALAQSHTQPGSLLGYGVLLHQIPVGLTVWWVLRDRARMMSWMVLLFMAVMTVAGYVAEPTMLAWLPDRAALWFEALVGGSLLHVIGHAAHEHGEEHGDEHGGEEARDVVSAPAHAHHHHEHDHVHAHAETHAHGDAHAHTHAASSPSTSNLARRNGAGSLLGLLVLVALQLINAGAHDEHAVGLGHVLWRLMMASAPAVLFAYGAIAILGTIAFVRRRPIRVLGIAVEPDGGGRATNGALSLEAALLSVPLLGVAIAITRLALAQVIATIGARTDFLPGERATTGPEPVPQDPQRAWINAVEQSAPWIIVGLMTAAVLTPVLERSWLTQLPSGVDVLVLTLAACVVSVHAAALVPVGAVLIAAGVSPGAVLALLLVGPLPDVRGCISVARRRGMDVGVRALLSGPVIAVASGIALNVIDDRVRAGAWSGLTEGAGNRPAFLAASLMVLLYVWVLGRRGIRGFLEPLHGRHDQAGPAMPDSV